MNKNRGIRTLFIAGIVFFQFAMLSLIGKDERGDSLSVRRLTNVLAPADVTVGGKMPEFPAYLSSGRRPPLMKKGPSTMIFKTDCTCDQLQVDSWIKAAARRNETVTVVVRASPDQLGRIQKENGLTGQVLAARSSDLALLGLTKQMPIAVHVSASGLILATES